MKDIHSGFGVRLALGAAIVSATATSVAVDLQGFNGVLAVVNTGAIVSSGDFTAKLQESNTTTSGDFTDVADTDLLGAFPASLAAESVVKVGYVGSKRYVRTMVTKNSGTSVAASITLVLGHPHDAPVA